MAKVIFLGPLLLVGLLGLTLTAHAEPDVLEWSEVNIPTDGKPGGWQLASGSDIQHLSLALDDSLYTDKVEGTTHHLMKSTDEGRTWEQTGYEGGVIAAIAGSRLDADIIYLTDGSLVYKSEDGGQGFETVGSGSLPTLDGNESIACLDIGYDVNDDPIIFIGTADTDGGDFGHIYYLTEAEFGASWSDLQATGYDVYSIAVSPDFKNSHQVIALATDETHTYIINNYGTVGDWSHRIELLEDNTASFTATAASRLCFYSDFDQFYEILVGITAAGSGDVYRVNEGEAYDLGLNADVISLELVGEVGQSWLLAGGTAGEVWHSTDDGQSWDLSSKAPSGDGLTYVVMATDFADSGTAYAATGGTESAFSLSRDGGLTWNQTSLIDTKISDIVDLAPSPDYSQDNTLFMLTHGTGGEDSLWRSHNGGTGWERVYNSTLPYVQSIDRLELAPQYAEDNQVVFLAGTSSGYPAIWRSADNGQSFTSRTAPRPIDAWAVVDTTTLFIGGYDGSNELVYRTTDSGLTYSEGAKTGDQSLNSIVLSPDHAEDETILVGNKDGWVYWSGDNGESFEPLPPEATSKPLRGQISVAFDPQYGSNNTVYATSNTPDEGIYRFIVGQSNTWENIASPAASMMERLIVATEGTLYAANFTADGGLERCLNPTYPLGPTFEAVTKGLDEGATLIGLWLCDHQLWSIDTTNTKLMTYIDSLTQPVVLTSPADQAPGAGTIIDNTVRNISLDWETLEGATEYRWQINYETDFSSLPDDFEGETGSSSARLPILEPATTYYWRVRAIQPVLSPWSEKWSFTTGLTAGAPAPELESPPAGASGVPVDPIFQWSAIAGAEGYELVISTDANLGNPTILKSGDYALPTTAWQCNIALNYNTTYYWKVRAISADTCSAWSAVSAFTTELPPTSPSSSTPEPASPTQSDDSVWPDWLVPLGGAFLLVIVMILITLIIVVIRVTR